LLLHLINQSGSSLKQMMSKNQFHNCSSHKNSSVAPQKNSHTWCVQTSKSSGGGGGGTKKNHSLKKSSDRSWSFKHLVLGIIDQFHEQLSN
jgi:hypothetical protein